MEGKGGMAGAVWVVEVVVEEEGGRDAGGWGRAGHDCGERSARSSTPLALGGGAATSASHARLDGCETIHGTAVEAHWRQYALAGDRREGRGFRA